VRGLGEMESNIVKRTKRTRAEYLGEKRRLPSEADLRTLFFEWGLQYKDIASIYGCCSQLVDSAFRKMGYRKGHWKIIRDDAKLSELISDESKTRVQLAKELGVCLGTLHIHARRLGFRRMPGINPMPPDEVLIRLHCEEKKSIMQIVKECGVGAIRTRTALERLGVLRETRDQLDEAVRRRRARDHNGREPKTYWYTSVKAPEGHPRAKVGGNGHIHYHILVAEKKLGRYLTKDEIVHHVDMIRGNNDPNNLYICENRHEHNAVHASLESIAAQQYAEGKLGFKDGEYYIKRKHNEFIREAQGANPKVVVLEKWLTVPELRESVKATEPETDDDTAPLST
jgi:hypothetical protein